MSARKEEGTLFYSVVILVALVPLLMFGGYTLQQLWLWFVTPLGVPAMGLVQAMGLRVFLNFVVADHTATAEDKTLDEKWSGFFAAWLSPGFSLSRDSVES